MSETLSLRKLIGWPSGPANFEMPLVKRCEAALDLTLSQQTPESLRLLIGQGIGVELLMPIALNALEQDILLSGDMYPGDVLSACQRVSASYWSDHPDDWARLNGILEAFDSAVELVNKDRPAFLASNPYGATL